jgi:DNA-3-methyladenine glycosylase II
MRPLGLFEMAVIAITEQQISLAAASAIRSRLIERFGTPVGKYWIFPEPRTLAQATSRQLRACGLSQAKARYVHTLARNIEMGRLDLAAIAALPDEEARSALMQIYGFGPWSAEYMLVRGMARPDRVPFDDLGVRSAVGRRFGLGGRASPAQAEKLLAPFAPYRGLAAFYLLVGERTEAHNP